MKQSAKMLEFEKAGQFRDQIIELRKVMEGDPADLVKRVVAIDATTKSKPAKARGEQNGAQDDKAAGKPGGRRRSRYS